MQTTMSRSGILGITAPILSFLRSLENRASASCLPRALGKTARSARRRRSPAPARWSLPPRNSRAQLHDHRCLHYRQVRRLVDDDPPRQIYSARACVPPVTLSLVWRRRLAGRRPRSSGDVSAEGARDVTEAGAQLKILHVVGTRPNFVKAAPVMRALDGRAEQILVYTGQHYDAEMSAAFFADLDLRSPDVDLAVGSGPPGVQTGRIMTRLEPVLDRCAPDACVVYGDVTSTLAAALVAAQHRVPLAHVEAGLRSRDRSMPEELNRILTDQVADWLFTPSREADDNLAREGIPADRVERRLPLPADVGAALVAALRSRPPTSSPDVIFVTARPPYRQLSGSTVSDIAERALRRAGVTVPRPGAHVFRHTVASQMVCRDVPMKTIGDLLGHARLETTTIYAKLDRETLATIALPWPGGAR